MKNIKVGDVALSKARTFFGGQGHRDLCTAYTMRGDVKFYTNLPGECRCNRKAVLALAELIDFLTPNWKGTPKHGDGCTPESCACYRRGIEGVLMLRCIKHFKVPQLNRTEHGGGECGACVQDEERDRCERTHGRKD